MCGRRPKVGLEWRVLAFVACWKGSEGGGPVMLWNVMCDAACSSSSCFGPKSGLKVSG